VTSFHLIFGCGYSLIAMIQLHRAYTGTPPGFLVTLNSSGGTMNKTQRLKNVVLGICSLVLGICYLSLAAKRHA
jgi:hypothetical protein